MADLKSTFLGIITSIFHKHCHLFCSVDPMPKLTLVRTLKINIGRRRKMQAAPKMITYLYKVVCFFSYKETFIPYSEIFYFAALNKLVYLME